MSLGEALALILKYAGKEDTFAISNYPSSIDINENSVTIHFPEGGVLLTRDNE